MCVCVWGGGGGSGVLDSSEISRKVLLNICSMFILYVEHIITYQCSLSTVYRVNIAHIN